MQHFHYTAQDTRTDTPQQGEASSNGQHNRESPPVHCGRELEIHTVAGYALTPVAVGGKAPIFEEWQSRDVPLDALRASFAESSYNIGVRLGEPSGDLIDIDLDCPEALAIADAFLPSTPAIFGRAGKPRSHRLYRARLGTEKFEDHKKGMLLELRSTGGQTVLPGSVHTSGESIEWDGWDRPRIPEAVRVDTQELRRTVALLAASTFLGQHYPAKGARHDFELGLAGGLLRAGVMPADAAVVPDSVAIAAGLTSDGSALGKVLDTQKKIDAGDPATGWPTVIESLGSSDTAKSIVNRVLRWLAVRSKAVRLSKDDFYAYLPSHKYIFRPTGELWDIAGINGNLGLINDGFDANGDPIKWKPSGWLDTHYPIHQITWLPGHPELVEDRLMDEGGLVFRPVMRA